VAQCSLCASGKINLISISTNGLVASNHFLVLVVTRSNYMAQGSSAPFLHFAKTALQYGA
jgi:hypothetical protein